MKKRSVIIIVGLIVLSLSIWKIVEYYNWKNDPFRPMSKEERENFEGQTKKEEPKSIREQNGVRMNKETGCPEIRPYGGSNCIEQIRENYRNTGKEILNEEYTENGQFNIVFMESSTGKSYESKVYTNCDCKILNVEVSPIR